MADETKTKRAEKTKRIFSNADGEDLGRNPSMEVAKFAFTDVKGGETVEVTRDQLFGTDVDVSKIKPAAVMCAWFGLKVNLGNAFGGKNATFEGVLARLEMILDGEWSEGAGESGPRKTILAEAMLRFKTEAGEERTIEQMTAALAAMTKEAKAEIRSHPAIALHYEQIVEENRKAKLKKLKAEAKEADTAGLDF